jgi:hypothetical protein
MAHISAKIMPTPSNPSYEPRLERMEGWGRELDALHARIAPTSSGRSPASARWIILRVCSAISSARMVGDWPRRPASGPRRDPAPRQCVALASPPPGTGDA